MLRGRVSVAFDVQPSLRVTKQYSIGKTFHFLDKRRSATGGTRISISDFTSR